MSNVFDNGEIIPDNLVRWCEEEGKDETAKHENEKCDIRSIIDRLESRVPVLSDGNSRSNDSAEIEDGPEISDISTLLCFDRIRHHDSPLSRPKTGSGNSEDGARGNDIARVLSVIVADP